MKICIKIYWILTKEIINDIGSFSEVLKKYPENMDQI